MIAWKFLARGAKGPFSGFAWPVPGTWVEAALPLDPCRSGLHVCRAEDLAYWPAEELWAVEVDGARLVATNALVVQRARLVQRVDAWGPALLERYRLAAIERVVARVAAARVPEGARNKAEEFLDAARSLAPIPATYSAAVAVSALAADESSAIAAFHAERAWHSAWLFDVLALRAG